MTDCRTGKRRYTSEADAKKRPKTMHQRFRVYFCRECHGYHVSKEANTRQKGDLR